MEIRTDVLARTRPTQSQTGLTRHQRRENVRGAFVLHNPAAIAGRDVLLIDDVFTTGTTVSECARVLRKAGAAKVLVVTVARVLAPEPTMAHPDIKIDSMRAMAAHA
jgi:predicted amidophosphoribosyltransferase